jgi:hypothetical protein
MDEFESQGDWNEQKTQHSQGRIRKMSGSRIPMVLLRETT